MNYQPLIVLTGFMGSGKSALGSKVASRTGAVYRDLDDEIEKLEGKKIRDIFRDEGEDYFRQLERSCLNQLLSVKPLVLALGGGAFAQPEIRSRITDHDGVTVFLDVPVQTLFERLKRNTNRPLLLDDDGHMPDDDRLMKRIRELLSQREPVYRKADISVTVQPGWTQEQSTEEILKHLSEHERTARSQHQ